jgi:hypothetical protein
MADTPYQMYLYVGPGAPKGPAGVTVVDLTPAAATPEAALAALSASGLTAADMRTRVLYVVDPGTPDLAVIMYAALCGFTGRRLDFTDMSVVVDARSLHTQALEAPDSGKPEELPEFVQVGAAHPDTDVRAYPTLDTVSVDDVVAIRYARRARISLADRGASEALTLLTVLGGLRVRTGSDRFPFLAPADAVVDAENPAGIDLDAVRRAAGEARRSNRIDVRDAVVDAAPLTVRQERLVAAAGTPVEDVLTRLGSYQDPDTGFWRCPRPDRHKNGDANPSTRVNDGLVRCFRCDTEPADSLTLAIDCLQASPDEAATWLLEPSTA